jgi:hypothetical protein
MSDNNLKTDDKIDQSTAVLNGMIKPLCKDLSRISNIVAELNKIRLE